jgi:hypothetical protein
MLKLIRSLFSPLRIRIPFLLDVVLVSNPEHIKRIEASGDVDRLHRYDTKSLPRWVRLYFQATRFYDVMRDLWFLALESASNPAYERRRIYLEEKVSTGYAPQDVKRIAELLKANADDEALAYEMVQVVNRRFFGEEIPRPITKAAKNTLQSFGEAVLPGRYSRATAAQRQVTDYCARTLPTDVHVLDIAHNLGEVVKTTARALRILNENLETSVEELFTSHALTPEVPRIAVRPSRFGGLLLFPTRAAKTVVIYKIGGAAAKTNNVLFTFGTGRPERACVFKDFFLAFMKDLQGTLREGQSRGSRA